MLPEQRRRGAGALFVPLSAGGMLSQMSVSGGGGQHEVSLKRVIWGGAFSFALPFGIGVLVALGQPDNAWHVDGLGPFLAVCGGLAALAAFGAYVAGAEPFAVGAMGGVPIAIGSIMRDGSGLGALFAIGAGLMGGWAAWAWMPKRRSPSRALAALAVVTIVLATPVGVFARVPPGPAARAMSRAPVLATLTQGTFGHVLSGRPGRFLQGSYIVRIEKSGLESWRAVGLIKVPRECRYPERTDGTDLRWLYDVDSRPAHSGVFVRSTDIERVCWILADRVAAGVAPEGTARITTTDERGRVETVPIGIGRSYIVTLQQATLEPSPGLVRISFWDSRGRLLDARAIAALGEYEELARASGLAPPIVPEDKPLSHTVTVSAYMLTPEEYRRFCRAEPPYGDGFISMAIVRRDDGVTREVVIGSGIPISSHHPTPDPPLVRPSNGTPCFLES